MIKVSGAKLLTKKVVQTIYKYGMFQKGDKVVVGVSGGADSVCLVHILNHEIKDLFNLDLYVAHLNHLLRGEAAERDLEFCRTLAETLKLPFYSERINVKQLMQVTKTSLEETARLARLEYFRKVACNVGAIKIALGHTKDDRVETILMWLLRGAGSEGLKGILPKRHDRDTNYHWEGYVVHPLIECSRKEILEYLKEYGLSYTEDVTNYQATFLRNRIRLHLLPLLEKEFNPQIKNILVNTATILSDEGEYLSYLTDEIFNKIATVHKNQKVSLPLAELKSQPKCLQRRLIRKSIFALVGHLRRIGFNHVESVLELVQNDKKGAELHLPNKIKVTVSGDMVLFSFHAPRRYSS